MMQKTAEIITVFFFSCSLSRSRSRSHALTRIKNRLKLIIKMRLCYVDMNLEKKKHLFIAVIRINQ